MSAQSAYAAVPVATIWTNPESPRPIDSQATGSEPNLNSWIQAMTRDEAIALCTEKRIQTQVLFGDPLVVESVAGAWASVVIPGQTRGAEAHGYPGWMPLCQLSRESGGQRADAEYAIIHSCFAPIDLEQGSSFLLSYGTRLPLIDETAARIKVITPLGPAYLGRSDCFFPSRKKKTGGPEIVRQAVRFLGLHYLWGGISAYGFDCSGFCYTLHRAAGLTIPRDAKDQFIKGKKITAGALLPGDLLFFAENQGQGRVHHVGIAAGNGRMIHSPTPGARVSLTRLSGTIYEQELCGIRRYWEK